MAWEPDGELRRLLDEHGFALERKKKHQVWKNPEGKIFICASTPSDVRAYANNLAKLRRLVGLRTPHEPGERRERRLKRRREPLEFQADLTIQCRPTWKEQLEAVKSNLHQSGVDRPKADSLKLSSTQQFTGFPQPPKGNHGDSSFGAVERIGTKRSESPADLHAGCNASTEEIESWFYFLHRLADQGDVEADEVARGRFE